METKKNITTVWVIKGEDRSVIAVTGEARCAVVVVDRAWVVATAARWRKAVGNGARRW